MHIAIVRVTVAKAVIQRGEGQGRDALNQAGGQFAPDSAGRPPR